VRLGLPDGSTTEKAFDFQSASIASATLLFSKTTYTNMAAHSAQFDASSVGSDDLDLVHASKSGDVAAFGQLVRRYDRKLLRIAQSVTHNTEDSQDAVQEAFLKAFQNLSQFREDSKFSTWLIRITVDQSLMKLRKQRRAIREVSRDDDVQSDRDMFPMEVTDWAPNPEQLYWSAELRDILVNALNGLRPLLRDGLRATRYRRPFNRSDSTGAKRGSHRGEARLWRARSRLRERLNKYFSKKTTSECPVSSFTQADGSDSVLLSGAWFPRYPGMTNCAQAPHPSPTIAATDHMQCVLNMYASR
jgi:RNA polymerase sigma-70 factor, ECF subfamily